MTEQMTWRERLLERALERDSSVLDVYTTPQHTPLEWEELQKRQEHEFMAHLDPSAAFQEEVRLRLLGSEFMSGAVSEDWDKVLSSFRATLKEFSPRPINISMSGISAGSTIVHFVEGSMANEAEDEGEDSALLRVHQTALADAAQNLFKVIVATEAHQALEKWAAHIEPFERFAKELSSKNLEADFRHIGSSGRVNGASLSRSGITYLEELAESTERFEIEIVNGRITELIASTRDDVSGSVKVKAGVLKNAAVTVVEFPSEAKKRLEEYRLGQNVSFRVRHYYSVDGMGRHKTLRHQFDHDVRQETSPLLPDSG